MPATTRCLFESVSRGCPLWPGCMDISMASVRRLDGWGHRDVVNHWLFCSSAVTNVNHAGCPSRGRLEARGRTRSYVAQSEGKYYSTSR